MEWVPLLSSVICSKGERKRVALGRRTNKNKFNKKKRRLKNSVESMWSKRHLARVENKKPFFDMKRGRGEIKAPNYIRLLKLEMPQQEPNTPANTQFAQRRLNSTPQYEILMGREGTLMLRNAL